MVIGANVESIVRVGEHSYPTFRVRSECDGELVGYGMEMMRIDDCLRAAVGTATQIPIQSVPDIQLDQRVERGEVFAEVSRAGWQEIEGWLAELGLCLRFHEVVPVPLPRWIGVTTGKPGEGSDHCLVMEHERVLFDPALGVEAPPGLETVFGTVDDIGYGISIHYKEERDGR